MILSNRFKYEKGVGGVDLSSCTVNAALMASGFVFDPATHDTYSDISTSELSAGDGYSSGGQALAVESAWARNDAENKVSITWADELFETTGADWSGVDGALLYIDSHVDKIVLGYEAFEETVVVTSDAPLELYNIVIDSEG